MNVIIKLIQVDYKDKINIDCLGLQFNSCNASMSFLLLIISIRSIDMEVM